MKIEGVRNRPVEWGFKSQVSYKDPFNAIDLDVIVIDGEGKSWKVPAFWAGGAEWKVRFSAPHPGLYTFKSVCTNKSDKGLDCQEGTLEISEYTGENKLYRHGSIRVMNNGRYFEHDDGTPFPWLGDVWWNLLSSRINTTDEINLLAKDRAEKGFTLVSFVNGFWCDLAPYDKRMSNEAGFAWTENFESINPGYFNIADLKIQAIADAGLALAVAGTWGFYMGFMGIDRMKKHFRYMVARCAAYPVIWIMAGEATMPYYDILREAQSGDTSKSGQIIKKSKEEWSEILNYLKEIDPFHRITSVHTNHGKTSVDEVSNPELFDFIMYQAGIHDEDHDQISMEIRELSNKAYNMFPIRPVVNGETCFEGMLYKSWANVQRWIFWHSMLEGCAGWTYGANGMFTASHKDSPFGTAYYGINWGEHTWQEAIRFDGGKQVGACRKYLNRYEWWDLIPAHDKVIDPENTEPWNRSIAAEIPGKFIFAYHNPKVNLMNSFVLKGITFKNLKAGARYHLIAYNPIRDYEVDVGEIVIEKDGTYITDKPPVLHDWLYILKKEN